MTKRLVVLPCHSVWIPSTFENKNSFLYGFERDEWDLVSFQLEGFDHYMFIDQILKSLISADSPTTVIISGGYTKEHTPEISESRSYFALMNKYYNALTDNNIMHTLERCILNTKSDALIDTFQRFKMTNFDDIVFENVHFEEYALDSFENLYYSLAYYRLINNNTSLQTLDSVVIIGFEFKEPRFEELHWKFLGCSSMLKNCKLLFDSNNPNTLNDKTNEKYITNVYASEKKFGYNFFEVDPFGRLEKLKSKKAKRNIKKVEAINAAPFKAYLMSFEDGDCNDTLLDTIKKSALYI